MSEKKKKLEMKEKLDTVLRICSECEETIEGKLCRDIYISTKIFFGCGKWKKDGEFILNQEFYDEIKNRISLKQVIEDLIKK